jgi:Mlc titration factor MtfA (ptsG expression regulator)
VSSVIFRLPKERRRERLRARAIPSEWHAILARSVPIFRKLPPEDRTELLGHVQVFLAEKNFEGCGGLELTEEIRVTIAAQACLLLLHRKTEYYPQLTSILVYPSGYTVPGDRYVGGDIWEEGGENLLGHTERHMRSLVLAWDATQQGALNPSDGQNLVLHEFAHQLDFEDYGTDGAPPLATRSEYLGWAQVMKKEFEALRIAAEEGLPTVLDIYGATNPAEFFAVVTEAFFELPRALRERHPELYATVSRFFRQDPARDFSE